MTTVLAAIAVLIALVAAVRSTWSPCGLSMLATITPLAEQGRGHRFRATAAWFVVGSVVGGATLGGAIALIAVAVARLHLSSSVLAAVALGACLLTGAADAGVSGFRLPVHHRQVNERWLDQFRPWVYGAGFGWQIGAGLVTYIKTCALYLMIVLAALTGSPSAGLLVGIAFGLVRGLVVYLGRHITNPAKLAEFHQRFMAAGPFALAAVILCEAAAALVFSSVISPVVMIAVAATIGIVGLTRTMHRRRPTTTSTTPADTDAVRERPVTAG